MAVAVEPAAGVEEAAGAMVQVAGVELGERAALVAREHPGDREEQ